MPRRSEPFMDDGYFHIFNRGVEKRIIFSDERDYQRFLQTLYYYQFAGPKPKFSTKDRFTINEFSLNPKIVKINCYCLMPNHFHLLIKQLRDNGITEFLGKVINSYTKYYNTKYKRVGHLFQGTFKAVSIETDVQLMHVSRYIHLNPYSSEITDNLEDYPYSSYPHFISLTKDKLCSSNTILEFFKNADDYKEFVCGHEDYGRELERSKHNLLDSED